MNAPVSAPREWNRLNEVAHRNYLEGELADSYRKSSDLIVPAGMKLGFNGTGGEQAVLQFDAGAFEIVIDGLTVISLATEASVTAVQSEVTAARSGEASLLARITTVNTTATNAGTAASTVQSEVSAARGGQASLSAKVTLMDSATVSAAGAAATAQSEVTAARQGEASLTAKVTQLSTATSTVDGKLSASYGLTVDGNGRIASMKLLSDGTTSSVKFLSTTFQVFNGTTDEAPFEVVGGVVKIKTANVGVLVAANIDTGAVTASKISVSSLDAVSATIGLLRTATSGARMELESNVIRAYDSSGTLRVRLGVWT